MKASVCCLLCSEEIKVSLHMESRAEVMACTEVVPGRRGQEPNWSPSTRRTL